MLCLSCFAALVYTRKSKQFCNDTCRQTFHRQQQRLRSHGITDTPACHLGRFQDYQAQYAGAIDVLITDPPYGREFLPLYTDLATFARTVLRPGGWLVCLTGFGIDLEVRQAFNASGLEFITVGCYHMPSTRSKARKNTSTGWRSWQEHHKPLLWYQQRGTPRHQRRAGGNDTIAAGVSGSTTPQMDQAAHRWEQDLGAFEQIIRLYTNLPDVICDPMMGWGTTLRAARNYDRRHLIGMEVVPERYAVACQQLALTPHDAAS